MKKKGNKLFILGGFSLILLLGIFALILILWYLIHAPAVLYRYVLDASPTKEPEICVFNPLRDKTVENIADNLLKELKAEKCHDLLAHIGASNEWIENTCKRESMYVLTSWQIIDRQDTNDKTTLFYKGNRFALNKNVPSPIWIDLIKENGVWKVIRYSSFY